MLKGVSAPLQGEIQRDSEGADRKRTADEARRVDKDAAVDARNLRQRIVANSAPTVRGSSSMNQLD